MITYTLKSDHWQAVGQKGFYTIGDFGGGKAVIVTPCGNYHQVKWDDHKQWIEDWDAK